VPIWRRFGVAAKENEISEKESWLPWQRPLKILKSRFRSFMYSHSGTEWTQLNAKKRNGTHCITLHCIVLHYLKSASPPLKPRALALTVRYRHLPNIAGTQLCG